MEASEEEGVAEAASAGRDQSLCHRCAARRYVEGRATTFVMCTVLAVKYPPQPVVQCEAFRPER